MLQTETLDKARCSHRDRTAALGFSATIAPSQCDLKLHDPGSALLHLSSSSPAPAKHSSNTVQWKDIIQNAQDHSASSALLGISCPEQWNIAGHCFSHSLAAANFTTLKNQMAFNLDFLPTGGYQ